MNVITVSDTTIFQSKFNVLGLKNISIPTRLKFIKSSKLRSKYLLENLTITLFVESITNGLNQYNKDYNLKQSIIFLYLKWPLRLLYLQHVSTYVVFPLTY